MNETGQKEVFIPGVSADMMSIIIDYAYTRDCHVTAENVERLLPAADQFHVIGLMKSCCEFLASQLAPENCIGIRDFARYYFCRELERTSQRYIYQGFSEISSQSNEILVLSLEELKEILSSDDLNVKNEETVFEAAIRWIDHDTDRRKKCIVDLLGCIRLGK